MINSVRNTVLAVANKQNFGYISPGDFNLYAKQAQLDIFENYFYRYNEWVAKQNARVSGSGYADIVTNLEEVVDIFYETESLTAYSGSNYPMPDDYYMIVKLNYGGGTDVDRISNAKANMLNSSNLTAPTTQYPVYVQRNFAISGGTVVNGVVVFPNSITNGIVCEYIRKPKDPKWTYVTLDQGEPLFDQSANDYQDFELPATDEPLLVAKILQYAGISIREADIYKFGQIDEANETQKQG